MPYKPRRHLGDENLLEEILTMQDQILTEIQDIKITLQTALAHISSYVATLKAEITEPNEAVINALDGLKVVANNLNVLVPAEAAPAPVEATPVVEAAPAIDATPVAESGPVEATPAVDAAV